MEHAVHLMEGQSMVMILIPLGETFLALSHDEFEGALVRGQQIVSARLRNEAVSDEKILDADGMQELTGIPASWFLEQARQGNIPHFRAGKYVRFRAADLLAALERRSGHADKQSVVAKKRPVGP